MKKIYCLLFSLLIQSSLTHALTLDEQRTLYANTVKLQEQGLWQEAQQQSSLLGDYPLRYLLDYAYLKENFSPANLPTIQAFIKKNSAHKTSDDLQRSYLYYLAKNKYWSEYLSFYPALPKSKDLKCYQFQAKIALNKAQKIWPEVKKTWLTGYSLPNACDPVLAYYFANKKITQPLIWERFKLAYLNNQTSLLRYLTKLMDTSNQTLANQLLAVNQTPEEILANTLFSQRKQSQYSLLVPTIKRLARKNISLGMDAYTLYDKKIGFNNAEKESLKKYFVNRILILENSSLFSWLDKELPKLHDDSLVERRIRYAIKHNNWSDIDFWIQQLSASQKQNSKWQYWQARVFENNKASQHADLIYKKLANTRTYYGFLAAQKLGMTYQFNALVVPDNLKSLGVYKSSLSHIEELFFQKHTALLKREWVALLQGKSIDLQRQFGLYAKQNGWSHLSVVASIRSKSWDALSIRFPEVKPDIFNYTADKYKIAPSYIYAITRQESSFDEYALSPAGAKGYMQLMPNTAKETARKIGLTDYKGTAQLSEGKINLQLGGAYLNMMLERYQGNRVLATAAYNAGPHRVDRWLANAQKNSLSMDSWVESIPYNETRRYVKNVLAYNVIYQHILDKPLEFLTSQEINKHF
jgi:soluble lytic murein transglycosylase